MKRQKGHGLKANLPCLLEKWQQLSYFCMYAPPGQNIGPEWREGFIKMGIFRR